MMRATLQPRPQFAEHSRSMLSVLWRSRMYRLASGIRFMPRTLQTHHEQVKKKYIKCIDSAKSTGYESDTRTQ